MSQSPLVLTVSEIPGEVVGGGVLFILLALMGILLVIGGGREHS